MWRQAVNRRILVALCVCGMAAGAESVQVIYVDDDAAGTGSGSSWADACRHLQDALAVAATAAEPVEIHLARGVYRPDQGAGITPGDRTATFRLRNGVVLRGGYAGVTAPDPDVWDPQLYETILSGDLQGNDVPVKDPNQLFRPPREPTRADNSVHVVTAEGADETAVLEGLVIVAGCSSFVSGTELPANISLGGGMFNEAASPTIRRCLFRDNFAALYGGAVYNRGGKPTFSDCRFEANISGSGAGALHNERSTPVAMRCTFTENVARNDGGAVYNDWRSAVTLTDCIFVRNGAQAGGALYNCIEAVMDVEGCTFEGNRAAGFEGGGGAIWNCADLMLARSTFRANFASRLGGALCAQGGVLRASGCSFSGNTVDPRTRDDRGGGAIRAEWHAIAEIEDSAFEGNSAPNGGALYAMICYAKVLRCRFRNNTASVPEPQDLWHGMGGALGALNACVQVAACDFQGNRASREGGAISSGYRATLVFMNCVLAGNRSPRGGAISAAYPGVGLQNCTLACNHATEGTAWAGAGTLEHCIVWAGGSLGLAGEATVTAICSDIEGGYPGPGNINADPLFVRPGRWVDANDPNQVLDPEDPNAIWASGDYHLQSQAGHWDSDAWNWAADPATSPCIDAGNPGTPIGDEPFPNGGILNLGAYGGTAEASRSYFGGPVCETPIAGDLNGDCRVDAVDAELMQQSWRISGATLANQPPVAAIIAPADGAVVEVSPSDPNIVIVVAASDADGFIREVGFSATQRTDNSRHGTSTMDNDGSDGWQWRWNFLESADLSGFPPGPYTLSAYTIDDDCEMAFAQEIHITVIVAK